MKTALFIAAFVGVGSSVLGSTPIQGLPISVSRYKDTGYQLSADQPLATGEYAVVFADRMFTFDVDGK